MKEIVVISGKGGTGKTSVTASLASISENSILADCDVDAADLHLLLNPKVKVRNDFISGHEAVIDSEKCISCGICEEKCRFDAISHKDSVYRVDGISCEGCKVCVELCPVDAIDFPDTNCGEWYISDTDYGAMVHARLKAGAENSGKLVSTVRREAKKIAEKSNADWIIVDGPPGIGCPVISSITGSDAVIVVTESTLSGKHDLERVLKLAKHFSVPAFVVINKWDINREISSEIEIVSKTLNAKIVGKLPYSPLFTKAQVKGVPIVKEFPDSDEVKELHNIWNNINK